MSLKRETRINLVLAFIFLGLGIMGFAALKATRPEIERSLGHEGLARVRTLRAQQEDLQIRIPAHGKLRSTQTASIKTEIPGRLSYLHPGFLAGGLILKDEILARIDPKEYELKAAKAKAGVQVRKASIKRLIQEQSNLNANLKIARDNLSLTRAEIKRYQEMLAQSTVAKQDYENILFKGQQQENQVQNIENQLKQIPHRLELERANLAISRLELEQAKIQTAKTVLKAGFSGKVVSESVSEGEFLPGGFSLGKMVNLETLEVETPFSSHEVPWLVQEESNPRTALVHVLSPPLGTLTGLVTRQGSHYEKQTGTVLLYVQIENPWLASSKGAWLLPGASCKVEILGPKLKQVTRVPRTSESDGRIQLVRDGRIQLMEISPLRDEGSFLVVQTKFKAGDEIVLRYSEYLSEGEKVKTEPQLLNLHP